MMKFITAANPAENAATTKDLSPFRSFTNIRPAAKLPKNACTKVLRLLTAISDMLFPFR